MNILIVNQSIIDMLTSFLTLLTAVVEVDGTGMSLDSAWDQFVCLIWLTRVPLWSLLFTSTYGILLMTLDRFVAVIYPVWYSTKVRNVCIRVEDKIGICGMEKCFVSLPSLNMCSVTLSGQMNNARTGKCRTFVDTRPSTISTTSAH